MSTLSILLFTKFYTIPQSFPQADDIIKLDLVKGGGTLSGLGSNN